MESQTKKICFRTFSAFMMVIFTLGYCLFINPLAIKANNKNFSDVLENKDLGVISSRNIEIIMSEFKKINDKEKGTETNLNKDNFQFSKFTDDGAEITSNEYNGAVIVNFKVPDLSTVLKEKKLGEIETKSKEKIKAQIDSKNTVLQNKSLLITILSDTQALVKSGEHEGSVVVDFTVKQAAQTPETTTNTGTQGTDKEKTDENKPFYKKTSFWVITNLIIAASTGGFIFYKKQQESK